jgi:hypothetical protein
VTKKVVGDGVPFSLRRFTELLFGVSSSPFRYVLLDPRPQLPAALCSHWGNHHQRRLSQILIVVYFSSWNTVALPASIMSSWGRALQL